MSPQRKALWVALLVLALLMAASLACMSSGETEDACRKDVVELGYTFWKYENNGIAGYNCWGKKPDGTPVQVW